MCEQSRAEIRFGAALGYQILVGPLLDARMARLSKTDSVPTSPPRRPAASSASASPSSSTASSRGPPYGPPSSSTSAPPSASRSTTGDIRTSSSSKRAGRSSGTSSLLKAGLAGRLAEPARRASASTSSMASTRWSIWAGTSRYTPITSTPMMPNGQPPIRCHPPTSFRFRIGNQRANADPSFPTGGVTFAIELLMGYRSFF